jgi:hypothetical protein
MIRELFEAVRELRLDPSQPVLVLVEGLLVELRAVRVPSGGATMGRSTLEGRAREIQALQRVARLIAAARAVGMPDSGQRRTDGRGERPHLAS